MLTFRDCRLDVEDDEFAYLKHQQGTIYDLCIDKRTWKIAYQDSLFRCYQSMVPFLPPTCSRIVDIGSGLGGIDAVLNRHYGGGVSVVLLDGRDDLPVMVRHDKPFSCARVARKFLARNGVKDVDCSYADDLVYSGACAGLGLSIASWCFHYPAETYLQFAAMALVSGATLIVDVRTRRPDWSAAMRKQFREVACALEGDKFRRMVYAA